MPFEVTKLGEQPKGKFEVTKLGSGESTAQEHEGWGPYIGRNVAQLVTTTPYSLVRSGLGIGNLINAALQDLPMPEGAREFLLKEQQSNIPTVAQARQEAAAYLPKFATEMKPGDEWIQQGVPLAAATAISPIMAARQGMAVLPAAVESILSTLGGIGGSQLGANVAQGIFPESKLAPELGGLAGGFGGGLAGRLVPGTGKSIMPSRALAPEKVLKEAKPEQKTLYGAAEQLAEGVAAKPTKLLETANKIEKRYGYGMAEKDIKDIDKLIGDIKAHTQSGENSPAGTLSLEEAKAFRREIGHRFKDVDTPTMKHNLDLLNKELKEFILKEGSSEHNALWTKAEKLTQNIGDLEKKIARTNNRPEWLKNVMRMSKLGAPTTVGSLLKLAGASSKLASGVGGLSLLAQKMFSEANYLRNISKRFPSSYNKYLDTVWHAIKSDSPKVILRLNNIAEELNEKMPFEEEKSIPAE